MAEVPSARPKLILCLGNPGPEYSVTRHNAGWWFADILAEAYGLGRFRKQGNAAEASGQIEGVPVQVVKPYTYMNRSGDVLGGFEGRDLLSDLLVVVDEIALGPGRARLRPGGSAGGHNGLKSVEAALGTTEYPRLRIGVGAPPSGADLVEWVLSPPPLPERQAIFRVMDFLVDCVAVWAVDGIQAAMNHCNSWKETDDPSEDSTQTTKGEAP